MKKLLIAILLIVLALFSMGADGCGGGGTIGGGGGLGTISGSGS